MILRIALNYEGINVERRPLTTLEPIQFRRTGSADIFCARVICKVPYGRGSKLTPKRARNIFATWPRGFLSQPLTLQSKKAISKNIGVSVFQQIFIYHNR